MRRPRSTALLTRFLAIVLTLVALLAGAAACSNSSGHATSGTTTAGFTPAPGGTDLAAAQEQARRDLAPYTGHASPFPVSAPLIRKPPAGTRMAFLQCPTPICALFAELIVPAARAMGVTVTITKSGSESAQSLQQAMTSIIAEKPAAVLLPATDPVLFRTQMQQLQSDGIPVISQGIADTTDFPAIKGVIFGAVADTLAGKLLADWVVSRSGNAPSVFYSTSELAINAFLESGFKARMATLCPSCQVRYVEVPVSTIGSTAPSLVANDLTAHPQTKTAVFAAEEVADGVPAALSVAGIHVAITGFAPDPEVLGYIKSGSVTSGLGYDALTSTWEQIDEASRILTGQSLTASESNDQVVFQMLTKADITYNPSKGFTGYPDAPRRFAALWSGQ